MSNAELPLIIIFFKAEPDCGARAFIFIILGLSI